MKTLTAIVAMVMFMQVGSLFAQQRTARTKGTAITTKSAAKRVTVVVNNSYYQTTRSNRAYGSSDQTFAHAQAAVAISNMEWWVSTFGCGPAQVPIGSFTDYLLPWRYETKYGGITYYQLDGVYFTKSYGGYVVSSAPTIIPQPVVIQESLPIELQKAMQH